MWKKIQKFSLYRLQGISVWSGKNPFFGPAKNGVVALHKVTFEWKKSSKWGLFLGFILQGKLATCLKNFRSLGIVQHIGKRIVSRKK